MRIASVFIRSRQSLTAADEKRQSLWLANSGEIIAGKFRRTEVLLVGTFGRVVPPWAVVALLLIAVRASYAASTVSIPRLNHEPKLEDFEGTTSAALRKVTDFIQRTPSDGQPATERTDAYLGYDQSNLYVVFVCWEDKPHGVRADLTRREPSLPFDSDDYVEITLDTFQDQRHAFVFDVNPIELRVCYVFLQPSLNARHR